MVRSADTTRSRVRRAAVCVATAAFSLLPSCFLTEDEPAGATSSALCDDGNPCTFDVWGFGGCVHNPVSYGTSCTLTSFCGTNSICNGSGTCITPSGICDDREACTTDACTYSYGSWSCTHGNAPSGTSCSDANACTTGDACDARGNCFGDPVDTDDSNICTDDACDPATGTITHTPVTDGTPCEDADVCNGAETCVSGTCTSGTPLDPDDQNICTTDTCDPVTGVHNTPVADGTDCTDGNFCNGAETCQSGSCESGSPPSCDDANACTVDECSPVHGCMHSTVSCYSTACSVGSCDPAVGCVYTPVDCNDNDACTTDGCDDVTGCYHSAITCDDTDPCTIDSCNAASGCVFTPKICTDANPCTFDTCDSQTGLCVFPALVDEPCDDGDICTESDHCDAAGVCGGAVVDSDDGNACTADSCDSVAGILHEPEPAGASCTDGDATNGAEVCDGSGACVGLPASESVVARVGGQDPDVRERRLGSGRHPVAASEHGLAVAFQEISMSDAARVGVATFSPIGEGLGLWYQDVSTLEPDPVIAAVPGGGFVVAYDDLYLHPDDKGDGLDVRLVRLDASGQQTSSVQFANEYRLYGQHSPEIVWQDDRLWVAWQDDSTLLSQGAPSLCYRAFSEDLVPLTGEQCDGPTNQTRGNVSMAATQSGLATAWRLESNGAGSLQVSWSGSSWSLPLDALPAEHELAAVAALDASHLVVVYTVGLGDQMLAVLDDAGGSTSPLLLNPYPARARFEPSLAVTADGVFLAWREVPNADGDFTADLEDVMVQRLTWDGATLTLQETWTLPHDGVFMLGDQRRPSLASTPVTTSGALWAAWNDLSEGQAGPEHGDVRVSLMPTPIERTELAY